jgi:hypothetical protein
MIIPYEPKPHNACPYHCYSCLPCSFHALTLTLLKAAWRRAQQLVAVRADAIRAVAAELLTAEDEKVEGSRLVEIIEVSGGIILFSVLVIL